MGRSKYLFIIAFSLLVAYVLRSINSDVPVPDFPSDLWWGPGERREVDESILPFEMKFSDPDVSDLKKRLERFLQKPATPPLENVGFEYGFNSDYLHSVITYWKDHYDWPQRQKFLNKFPQFLTRVNGLKIHYVRVAPTKTTGKRILPIILLHGWPGSFREFYEIIPRLVQPNDSTDFIFEVIVPSLPGFGFSEAPAKTGMGPAQIAVVLNNLMVKIGFDKYYAHGTDIGAAVAKLLGTLYPNRVFGVHFNSCFVNCKLGNMMLILGNYIPRLLVDKEHEDLVYPLQNKFFFILEEFGYFHLQATKPDTIGTALSDTPVGVAAYILEKFSTWTNPSFKRLKDGGITKKYTLDTLLDNLMVYWISNSITTSMRLYAEVFTLKYMELNLDEIPITIPTACARFEKDLLWTPEKIIRLKYQNLVQLTDFKDGGHFPALENPEEVTRDIFAGIQKMENLRLTSKKNA